VNQTETNLAEETELGMAH
jgi:hypothetical protein